MEKQKVFFGLGAMLVCSLLLLSGCTQQQSPSTKESIQDILAKAENIGPVYYEITSVVSMPGIPLQNSTMKVWQKTPYMKFEVTTRNITSAGNTTLEMIVRPDGFYVYDSTQQKYVKTMNTTTQKSFKEQAQDLLQNQTLSELGTETIDGKTTTIIQYSTNGTGVSITTKLWVWNEKGIPLKAIITTNIRTSTITTTMEYKNFVFENISDSTFDVS